MRIFGNEAGSALAAPADVPAFVDAGPFSSVVALDLLDTGTGCLAGWSLLPGSAAAPLRAHRSTAKT
ncbi:hypothetical protein ACMHYB_20865 [Sorangium sp. So ce1128]